jgi:hypothetical protein
MNWVGGDSMLCLYGGGVPTRACRFPYLLRMEWDACSYDGCVCTVVGSRVTLSALFVEGAARGVARGL